MTNPAPIPKPVNQAVMWVRQQIASSVWRGHPTEKGCLFWLQKDGTITPGELVDDGDPSAVRHYSNVEDRRRALNGLKADAWPKLAGEFHFHTAKRTAVGYLPSPDDVLPLTASVASDHWRAGEYELPLSPAFQIILLLPFDLLWVVERDPTRVAYDSFDVQQKDLGNRGTRYSAWHRLAHLRLGALPPSTDLNTVRRVLGAEQPAIQEFLAGRCTIRLE